MADNNQTLQIAGLSGNQMKFEVSFFQMWGIPLVHQPLLPCIKQKQRFNEAQLMTEQDLFYHFN